MGIATSPFFLALVQKKNQNCKRLFQHGSKTLWFRKFTTLYSSAVCFFMEDSYVRWRLKWELTLDCVCAAWSPSANDRNEEVYPCGLNSLDCGDLIQETFKCWSGQAKPPCELFGESKTCLRSLESPKVFALYSYQKKISPAVWHCFAYQDWSFLVNLSVILRKK